MPTQYIEHPVTKERIPFEWNNPNPPTSQDIEGLFQAVSGQKAEPTTGQKIARAVSPYVRPLAEAGGATIGGILAAPTIPATFGLGEAAGIAGGYLAGKKGADLLDEYAGVKPTLYGTDALKQLGMKDVPEAATMGMLGPIIGKGVQAIGDVLSPYAKQAAERVYGSAIKMPLGKKWTKIMGPEDISQREEAIRAGLKREIPPSKYGREQAAKIKEQLGQGQEAIINEGTRAGTMLDVDPLVSQGSVSATRQAQSYPDKQAAQGYIDGLAQKIVDNYGPSMTPTDANNLKKTLYKLVSWPESTAKTPNMQLKETEYKGVAHEIMGKLEELFPELKTVNKQYGGYKNLQEALERFVGREGNLNLVPLGTKVLLRPEMWPMALLDATLGHPQIKARLAFLLNKVGGGTGASMPLSAYLATKTMNGGE